MGQVGSADESGVLAREILSYDIQQAPSETCGIRLHDGDATVLTEILRRYGRALTREILRRFGPLLQHADVEDVLSIALFRLWRTHASFDPARGCLGAWFRSIALNVARNLVKSGRSKMRRRQVLTDPQQMDRLPCRMCADDGPHQADESGRLAVLRALDSLPRVHRGIVLADAESPTGVAPSATLSQQLGIKPASVREYRRRALVRLRHLVENTGEREREREANCSDAQYDGEL